MTSAPSLRRLPGPANVIRTLRSRKLAGLTIFMGAMLCVACNNEAPKTPAASVTARRIINADQEPGNWLTHGRTYSEQRYSPLEEVHSGNVARLGLAWHLDLDTTRGQETTPLVIDGVMYTTSAWSKVQAIEAATGRLLWQFDPQVPGETAVNACCDVVNRGVAAWQGRLYVGTLDGRLIALDAATGRQIWATVTVDRSKPYTITGAPRVVKGKVIIGNGGAEFGVRGYVSAYDANDGTLAWRFYTVPGDPSQPFENQILEKAAQTWSGEWWKAGGGGTVWDSLAYDSQLDLLYIGVGNGSPWNAKIRSPDGGDNLFLSSIVALRPDTGSYVWHYQTTPGEMWDYTATQHMILADMVIGGTPRKVLMQAPKNGFFYVLDRASGELLSAEPYAPINWASRVDMTTGRPVVNPEANYSTSGKPWLAMPGPLGAHSWHPMSFSPRTGLVYLPSFELSFPFLADGRFTPSTLAANLGIDLGAASLPQDAAIKAQVLAAVRGHLVAWDPVRQRKIWQVEHAGGWNGGVLSTAGNLVFQGDASGSFTAYDARNGVKLWSFATGEGIVAPPVSYIAGDHQYIAVAVGWGGVYPLLTGEIAKKASRAGSRGRILAFRIDAHATLPTPASSERPKIAPPPQFADAETIAAGARTYQRYCGGCHGDAAVSGGVLPDLRWSAMSTRQDTWTQVVMDGVLRDRGMVGFARELSPQDAEAIRAYVIERAHQSRSPAHSPTAPSPNIDAE